MLSNCRPIPLKPTKALTFDSPMVSRLALTGVFSFVAPLEIYSVCPVLLSIPKLPVTITKPNRLIFALPTTWIVSPLVSSIAKLTVLPVATVTVRLVAFVSPAPSL